MQSADAVVERNGDGVETHALFGAARECGEFEQRVLRFVGRSDDRCDEQRDEVLYVLSGSGAVTIGREHHSLATGTAAYVAKGTGWHVDEADELVLLSVLVEEPLPANGTTHAVVDLAAEQTHGATSGRQFRLLATPEVGCASVTQFVGYIPVGRAPEHFHRYDEVVYVLEGEGSLHIGGESAPLRPGSCRPSAGTARPLPRECGPRRDAGARRVPPRRLSRRGVLPGRHPRRRTTGGLTI